MQLRYLRQTTALSLVYMVLGFKQMLPHNYAGDLEFSSNATWISCITPFSFEPMCNEGEDPTRKITNTHKFQLKSSAC